MQKTSEASSSLEFRSYDNDWLASTLLERLQWDSWQFPVLFVSAYIVAAAVGSGVHLLRFGGFDAGIFGGTDSIIVYTVNNIMLDGLGGAFYLYFCRKSGTIFDELAARGVLERQNEKVNRLVLGAKRSVRSVHHWRHWSTISFLFALIIISLVVFAVYINGDRGANTRYVETSLAFLLPLWTLSFYIVGIITIRASITVWGLYRVFRVNAVSVYPLHPDRCGGFQPLRDYALSLSYLLALFGLGIVLTGYTIIDGADVGGEKSRIDLLIGFPALLVLAGMYVIFAPLSFFGTLWTAHKAMREEKDRQLANLSGQFTRDIKFVQDQANGDIDEVNRRFERLERVQSLHRIAAAFPVWPFDMASIRQFAAASTSPIVLTGGTILVQVYLL